LGDHVRELIERRIQEYLADDDPRFSWLRPAVRKFGFLPLYLGWVAVLGIRPDESLVRWDNEDDPEVMKPLSDAYWERMALCQGAKKYPELARLLPQRPAKALQCESCNGTGQIAGLPPHIICECGGLGWIIPGEQQGPSPG
jgi:hypothetical protein